MTNLWKKATHSHSWSFITQDVKKEWGEDLHADQFPTSMSISWIVLQKSKDLKALDEYTEEECENVVKHRF